MIALASLNHPKSCLYQGLLADGAATEQPQGLAVDAGQRQRQRGGRSASGFFVRRTGYQQASVTLRPREDGQQGRIQILHAGYRRVSAEIGAAGGKCAASQRGKLAGQWMRGDAQGC